MGTKLSSFFSSGLLTRERLSFQTYGEKMLHLVAWKSFPFAA
jgi:hypothetical protein